MANNQQNINGQIDFASLGAQLATTIADAFKKGTAAGVSNMGKSFTGSSFLDTLNAQMDEFADKQKTSAFNTRVQNLAMRTGIDTRQLELALMGKEAILMNKRAIAEATRAGDYSQVQKLMAENVEIKKQVEERKKQLVEEDKLEESLKNELKTKQLIEKIDQERSEMIGKINEKAHMLKLILTDQRVALAALTAGAMKFGEAFSEGYKELKASGQSVTQALTGTFTSFTDSISTAFTSGFIVSPENIRKARQSVLETGGTLKEAADVGDKAALMAEKFGGSVENAGKAVGNLQKLPGLTKAAAVNTAEFGSKLALAANVPADTVTKAIANNMDAAAKAGPSMTKSFAMAAINAQKIGVEFSTIVSLSDKLLNFESSINAQMEASVLLGKEINLDRAREAALQGDYATVQKEILKNVGSEAEFAKMNVLQRQKLADAMGVSVGDLAKMVKGQGELSNGTVLEADARKQSHGYLEGMVDLGAKHAKTLLGMIPSLLSLVLQYKTLNALQGNQTKGVKGFFGNLFGKGGQNQPMGPTPPPGMNQPGPDGMISGLGKNMNNIVKGAAAAAILAGALWILGKALQEFEKVSWESMGKAAVGLIGLTAAVIGLGALMNSGFGAAAILAGAAAIVIMGGAIAVLAIAIKDMGEGFGMMEPALKLLVALGGVVPNLLKVGEALVEIKNGLTGIGETSATAMPVLNKLSELAGGGQQNGKQENPIATAITALGDKIDALAKAPTPMTVSVDGDVLVRAIAKRTYLSKVGSPLQ